MDLEEFQALSPSEQDNHFSKHEYYLGERRREIGNYDMTPIGRVVAVVDFCKNILSEGLNQNKLYGHCIKCGCLFDDKLDRGGKKIFFLSKTLSGEDDLKKISSGICSPCGNKD